MTVIEQKVGKEVKLMMMSDLHIGALHNDYKLTQDFALWPSTWPRT